MTPSQRLTDLGIHLPSVAAPVGSYVPARVHSGLIHVTGQLAFVDGEIPVTGVLGDAVTVDAGVEAARAATLNSLAAAAQAVGGIDAVGGVLQVVGYMACVHGFAGLSTVLNGASDLLRDVFGDAGVHTRSNVGVAWLPLGSPVEIQVLFFTASESSPVTEMAAHT